MVNRLAARIIERTARNWFVSANQEEGKFGFIEIDLILDIKPVAKNCAWVAKRVGLGSLYHAPGLFPGNLLLTSVRRSSPLSPRSRLSSRIAAIRGESFMPSTALILSPLRLLRTNSSVLAARTMASAFFMG